jgi:prepilin-type N-terminal cleavage/methylation domain-containing protein/prepilin-type processing-associated H-X9-DG protein
MLIRPRAAFTLIELLVVITIVAVLAAILFPVMASAKNAAKGAACLSNMRQIGVAAELYLSDNDDVYFPVARYEPEPRFAPQVPWIGYDNQNTGLLQAGFYGDVTQPAKFTPRTGLLDPYIKDLRIIKCPNQRPTIQSAMALNDFDPNIPSDYYAVNPAAQGQEFGPSVLSSTFVDGVYETTGAASSMVEEPSQTLLAWEHLAFAPVCNWLQRPNWYSSPPNDPTMTEHFNFLHTGGTNTLWCDGHVKRLSYGMLRRPMFSVLKHIYPTY